MLKNSENNETEEIGLVTTTLDQSAGQGIIIESISSKCLSTKI